jgi:hypothetical protein
MPNRVLDNFWFVEDTSAATSGSNASPTNKIVDTWGARAENGFVFLPRVNSKLKFCFVVLSWEEPMDWIEMLFGLAPDGGDGSLEKLISLAGLLVLVGLCVRVMNRCARQVPWHSEGKSRIK